MDKVVDIGEVARPTGLTTRALRFYDKRDLATPKRTAAGRRVYTPGELAPLNAVVALRLAGFSLANDHHGMSAIVVALRRPVR